MIKNLVILESPSKAKTVGKILGKDYMVVASKGHLRDLPSTTLGVDVAHDFEPNYINLREKLDTILEIKKLAKDSKNIYLASDPDREGEAIAWHLAYILGIDPEKAKRITFNEITKKGVEEGIKAPRGIDVELVDAYQARRVLDRLVGYKISPLLWKKIRKGLSAGRVQSVAVRLICDREEEIEAFKAKEFWTINAAFSKKTGAKTFGGLYFGKNGKKVEIGNEAQADEILKDVSDKEFTVSNVKKSQKKQSPFAPFTTSTLQQDAAHKLNFRTNKTMQIAQRLYEGVDLGSLGTMGLITYLRTDSVRVSDEAAAFARDYIKTTFGDSYIPKYKRVFKNKNQAQDAHEAIRPTHMDITPDSIKDKLQAEDYKLYKLIFDRFTASQMADAEYAVTQIEIKAGEHTFKANGRVVTFKGFEAAYDVGYREEEEQEDFNKSLPLLETGDVLSVKKIEKKQHFTQPPARFNEASLVKTLEELGIGRPSTYASIISTIQDREYIAREKKTLYPTEIGKIVNNLMKQSFPDIVDVTFTADIEKELDNIAQGDREWKTVVSDFYGPFEKTLENAEKELKKLVIPDKETGEMCELCGKPLVIKRGKYGDFIGCKGYPTCKYTRPIEEALPVPCPSCGKELVYKKSRAGKKFIACKGYPDCTFSTIYEPTGKSCPKCGKYLVYKRGKRFKYITCSDKECGYTPSKENKENEQDS